VPFDVYHAPAKSILSPTSGFIAEAGFTHSLSPARNCTFGCTYCYVPTMRLYGGLQPTDWQHWGEFTTFKSNAAELLRKALDPDLTIYCSPLVDPYQPAEAAEALMPGVLDALTAHPPRVFVIQTRGPLILRDLARLQALAQRTHLRVSFSIPTDRDDIRRVYEPRCASITERFETVRLLRQAGIATHATLAPLLPCNPEKLLDLALASTQTDIIGDAFHVRSVKKLGATTRDAAVRISQRLGHARWHDPEFQNEIVDSMQRQAAAHGRRFGVGPQAFRWLAEVN
jgi:DNA repair photolyase